MRVFFLLLAACNFIFSQRPEFGIISGIPATNTFDSGFIYKGGFDPKTVRYTLGPTIDFHLPGPFGKDWFAIKVDALYQRFGYHNDFYLGPPRYNTVKGELWQIPMLLSMRIPVRKVKSFVEAGPSVQIIRGSDSFYGIVNGATAPVYASSESPLVPNHRVIAGFAAGAGIDFRVGPLHLAPSVRYTRWGDRNINQTQIPSNPVGTHLNQIQVLLAFRL